MRRAAVLPLKELTQSKTRLADLLSPEQRQQLFRAMAEDVVTALSKSSGFDQKVVVTGDRELSQLALSHGLKVVSEQSCKGHSAAALLGIEAVLANTAELVVLIPGDCPAVTPESIQQLAESVTTNQVSIAPDRAGSGTNALALSPPSLITPSFGEDSFARHTQLALGAGAAVNTFENLELACDVDTTEDLAVLSNYLESGQLTAPNTARCIASEELLATAGSHLDG